MSEELFWEVLRIIAIIVGSILGFKTGWNMLKDKKKKEEEECRD